MVLLPLLAAAVALGQQSDDDRIVLPAREARIEGAAKLMGDRIGAWDSLAARAVWTTTVARAGTYRVFFEYACPKNSAGTEFEVLVGSQRANGIIAGTADWTHFTKLDLGPVFIRKPGPCRVEVVPTRSPRTRSLMDLRSITLQREG